MNKKVLDHFKKEDYILFETINRVEKIEDLEEALTEKYFENLCRSIINQQISNKAGAAIFARFKILLKDKITPENLLKMKDNKLRAAGLSRTKIIYIKDLAQKFVDQEIKIDNLKSMSNEEVIIELTKVKGIGIWTAEMFLMNCLAREDVFSYGDLGLKNAIKFLYNLENPTRAELEKITLKWSPYRTYASKTLWKSLKNEG